MSDRKAKQQRRQAQANKRKYVIALVTSWFGRIDPDDPEGAPRIEEAKEMALALMKLDEAALAQAGDTLTREMIRRSTPLRNMIPEKVKIL